MGKRVRQPTPPAHWALLGLLMVGLLAELSLNGYVTHVGSEGSGAPAAPAGAPGGPVPDAVTGGGAVQRIEPDGSVSSRSMPARTIALTFDDGPDPVWTPRILAVLARHGAHATFFQVGSQVNEHPEVARQVVAAGSEIGSHTFSHRTTAGAPHWRLDAELSLTANAVAAATGHRPVLMRPPYSSVPEAVTGADFAALRRIGSAGYLVALA